MSSQRHSVPRVVTGLPAQTQRHCCNKVDGPLTRLSPVQRAINLILGAPLALPSTSTNTRATS